MIIKEKNRTVLLLFLCLLGGAFLRLFLLGRIPYGLNHDEASIGYDAWALAHYGIDRNGYPWPIYPITWGSGGGSPLMIYLVLLTTRLFGKSVASLRFFPAFLGALTPPVLALLTLVEPAESGDKADKQASSRLIFAFFLAFLCAVNPWHLILSRWALDANTLPFFLTAALVSYLYAATRTAHRLPWYLLSAFLFALCPYAYGSATVVIPLALVLLGIHTCRIGRMTPRELLLSALLFLLILTPLLAVFAVNALHLPAIITPWFSVPRFTASRSVFPHGSGLAAQIKNNIRYLFLFFTIGSERDEIICNVLPGYAQMYRFTFPLTWIGLLLSLGGLVKKDLRDAAFVLLTAVTVLFSLFIELDINRMTMLLIPFLYFQSRALRFLYEKKAVIAAACCAVILCAAALFIRDYFGTRYADLSRSCFMPGYLEAVRDAKTLAGEDRSILSTREQLSAPFMLALYETELPPDAFLESVVWRDEKEEFRIATSFAGFTFGLPQDLSSIDLSRVVVILHESEVTDFPDIENCQVDSFGDFAVISR